MPVPNPKPLKRLNRDLETLLEEALDDKTKKPKFEKVKGAPRSILSSTSLDKENINFDSNCIREAPTYQKRNWKQQEKAIIKEEKSQIFFGRFG